MAEGPGKSIAGKTDYPPNPAVATGADTEEKFGTDVGKAFPVSAEILAAARESEKKEDALIDKNIADKRAAEKTPKTGALAEAFTNAQPLKERKRNGNGNGKKARNGTTSERSPQSVSDKDAAAEAVRKSGVDIELDAGPAPEATTERQITAPPELVEIYKDGKVPPDVLGLYARLGDVKKASYLELLRANYAAEKERKGRRRKAPAAPAEDAGTPVIVTKKMRQQLEGLGYPPEVLQNMAPSVAGEILETKNPWDGTFNPEDVDTKNLNINLAESEVGPTKLDIDLSMTPGEAHSVLSKLIEGYRKTLGVTRNVAEGVSERFTKSKEYLNNRAKEIDAQAETSGLEKSFRAIGEKYNKLSPIHKFGIGIALGVGTAVGSAFSLPLALAGLSGLVLQRGAGAAGMFVSVEKKLQEKKVGESFQFMATKERAAIDAMLYTFAMSAAISQGLEFVREHSLIEQAREWWLGDKLGHHAAPAHPITGASSAPEAPVPAAAPEVPIVMVHAQGGHGYEYMLKRMWEDLQEKHLDPGKYAENSDIHKLLTADPQTIDKVVHDIARDPSHAFYRPDEMSAVIHTSDILTVGTNGQVLLMTPDDVIAHAPIGGPTTLPYHPEALSAPIAEAPHPDGIVPPDTGASAVEDQSMGQAMDSDTIVAPGSEVIPAPAEAPVHEVAHDVSAEQPPAPVEEGHAEPPLHTPDSAPAETAATHAQDVHQQEIDAANASIHETTVAGAPEASTLMTKIDGVLISPQTPAIYQAQLPTGETCLTAYGGSDAERLKFIQEYLMRPENKGQTVRFAHEVPSILGPRIKVDEIGGVSTNAGQTSLILDFFKKPVSPPAPETFLKKLSN